MYRLVLILTVVLFAVACDNSEKKCDQQDLMDCSTRYLGDSLGLANAIAGKWKWENQLNCTGFADDPIDKKIYQGLVVELRADGTGQYTRNNNLGRFTWELKRRGKPLFFEIDNATNVPFPPHGSLYGTIYLCGDELMMSTRAQDGTDNIFRRF